MNKENEEPKSSAESIPKQPYVETTISDLGVLGGTIGVYLNMHSKLVDGIVTYPKNLVINKNNTAPCGVTALHTYRIKSHRRPHLHPEEIALQLTEGLDVCYTREQYINDLLQNRHVKYDEITKKITNAKKDGGVEILDFDEFFEGSCTTLTDIDEIIEKMYETRLPPGVHAKKDEPEFTIAFGGVPFNMLTESIDDFFTKFRIRRETITPRNLAWLRMLFTKIGQGRITSLDLNVIFVFFRDVFHITQVNIFDVGCSIMFDAQGIQFTKKDVNEELQYLRRQNPRLGFGGTKRKKNKKKTKKTRTK